jgi:hypothetical protein
MSEEIQAPVQPEFVFYGLQLIERSKPAWHSTGKILRRHRPEVYRIAVELLGAGKHSRREICELLHISHHTLESIEQDQGENLAALRQKAARKNLELHAMSLDRIEELIPRANDVAKLAVTAGILAEKSQLLAGEATARIEQTGPADLLQRFEAFCGALEKRAQAREIDVAVKNTPANSELEIAGELQDRQAESDSKSAGVDGSTQESTTDPDELPLESVSTAGSAAADDTHAAAQRQGGGGGRRGGGSPAPKSVTAQKVL